MRDASPANDTLTITARDSVIANFGSNALQRIGPGTANLTLDHVGDVLPSPPPHARTVPAPSQQPT
jgi:hypothetical protein